MWKFFGNLLWHVFCRNGKLINYKIEIYLRKAVKHDSGTRCKFRSNISK